jgi:SAM-dependent methyltransferase
MAAGDDLSVDLPAKFGRLADGFAEHEYADPRYYNARRARTVFATGPQLRPGATVLDLGCGDANFADEVLARGYCYIGADPSPGMVTAATRRLAGRGTVELGDFETYEPRAPVDATILLRVVYLVEDRIEVLRRIGEFTRTKIVFDASAGQVPPALVAEEARLAGFNRLDTQPFLASMRFAPPRPVDLALRALEHTGPLARGIASHRFRLFYAAYRDA